MGRTYSFEPFLSQQPAQTFKGSGPRLGNDESKTTLAKDIEQATTPPKSSTDYGQAHAETVKRYRKRAQARKSAAAKTPARPAAKAKKKTATEDQPGATTRRTPARAASASAAAPRASPRKAASEMSAAKSPARTSAVKSPARKSTVVAEARTLGRKVLERTATAAKRTVARAVTKTLWGKPPKKR
jgi:hypothetical protein